MAPDEASWATFMGQAEHGSDLPWPNFPQVKKIQIERKYKWLSFSYLIIDRRPKHFAFVASQLVSAYMQYHNWSGLTDWENGSTKNQVKNKMAAIF